MHMQPSSYQPVQGVLYAACVNSYYLCGGQGRIYKVCNQTGLKYRWLCWGSNGRIPPLTLTYGTAKSTPSAGQYMSISDGLHTCSPMLLNGRRHRKYTFWSVRKQTPATKLIMRPKSGRGLRITTTSPARSLPMRDIMTDATSTS